MTVKIAETIPLSKTLQKSWSGVRAMIFGSANTLIVKRVQRIPERSLRARMRAAGREISPADIEEAIRAARA